MTDMPMSPAPTIYDDGPNADPRFRTSPIDPDAWYPVSGAVLNQWVDDLNFVDRLDLHPSVTDEPTDEFLPDDGSTPTTIRLTPTEHAYIAGWKQQGILGKLRDAQPAQPAGDTIGMLW